MESRKTPNTYSMDVEKILSECKRDIEDAVKEYRLNVNAAIEDLKAELFYAHRKAS